ncbi:hypothetical protein NIES4103_42570 [Nostoc sp. NIES-4103]|nr:hypothetical protein NIES4103_42570 [Nostoc sp. NIES-4103]
MKNKGTGGWGLGIRDWVPNRSYYGGCSLPTTLTGSPVTHGGNPQDRTGSPNFKKLFPSPQSPVPSTNSSEESPTNFYV